MSEKLCALRKIGGMSEKALWTNPSPNANFPTQDITLSDTMENYKYIKFEFKASTNDNRISSVIMSVENFIVSATNTMRPAMLVNADGANRVRGVTCRTTTKLGFTDAYTLAQTGVYNTGAIPISVYGLK